MRSLVIKPSFPPAASWQLRIYIVTDDYEKVNNIILLIYISLALYTMIYFSVPYLFDLFHSSCVL